MAQTRLISDLVELVTPNNDDVFVVVDNTTNPSLSVTKRITYANLKEGLQDMIDLLVSGGTGIDASYNDGSNTLTLSVVADTTVQQSVISSGGTAIGTRREINFIPGASILLSGTDNPGSNRVDLAIRTNAVSTASNLVGSGTTYNVLSSISTLGDGTQDLRFRTLKAGSAKVSLGLADGGNSVTVDIVPSGISINDLNTASPLAIGLGGTNATTASDARSNLGAAKAGDNTDITSLSGLTTALSVNQGGTGGNTAQVALRNLQGLNSVANVATAGQSIVANASTLVGGNYRAELRGIRAGSSKITVGVVGNDISINANSDLILAGATQDVNFNGYKLTSIGSPVSSTDAATKDYVDSVAQGLVVKEAVLLATVSGQVGTYAASGQTFTYTATGTPSIDGVSVTATGTRVLFKDQAAASENGIYELTTSGDVGISAIFTRAVDYNTNAEAEAGSFAFVLSGTTNSGKQYVQTTQNPTLDTDSLVFTVLNDLAIPENSVTNTKLEHMPALRVKGTVVSGTPQDLTADQVITVINSGGTTQIDSARVNLNDVTITGNVTLNAQGDLRFADADSSNYVAFQAPATIASNIVWTLPETSGTTGQFLSTDGSNVLSWASGFSASVANTFTAQQTFSSGVALSNSNVTAIKNATFNSQASLVGTSGSINIDWNTAQNQRQPEPTGTITYTFTDPPGPCHLQLLIDSDGTSTAQTIIWPGSVVFLGAAWTGANNKKSVLNFWYDGTSYIAIGTNQV